MGKLFFGSQTGTTEAIAEKIESALSDYIDESKCIMSVQPDDFKEPEFLVLGGSTWGDGELTDDWADFYPQLDNIDFNGKTVALFSLGDQYGYGHNFVSAMRLLYDKVKERGGTIIADQIPLENYDYEHSESVIDDHLIGLAVDEVNQPELTDDRIEEWVELIRAQLPATAKAN